MFALAIIPVIGLVGAAVDYSRANSIRSAVQSALDATALAMAKLGADADARASCRPRRATISTRCSTGPTRRTSSSRRPTTHDRTARPLTIDGDRRRRHDVHAGDGLHAAQHRRRRRPSSGATSACASRSRSTPPARWRAPARSTRSRPRPRTCSTSSRPPPRNNGDVYVSIIPFSKDVNVGSVEPQRELDRLDRLGGRAARPSRRNKPGNWEQSGQVRRVRSRTATTASGCTSRTGERQREHLHDSVERHLQQATSARASTAARKIAQQVGGLLQRLLRQQPTLQLGTGESLQLQPATPTAPAPAAAQQGLQAADDRRLQHTWIKNARSTWNGCVTDRGNATAPGTTQTTTRRSRRRSPARRPRCSPARAVRLLLARGDGPELQLDRDEDRGRRPLSGRQHQSADRPGLGLAVAGRRRSAARCRPRMRTTPTRKSSS